VLGLALEQKGALVEAAGEMRRVHDLSPSHLGALSHLVTIATRLGRGDEAVAWRRTQQEALSRAHVEERVRDHRIKGVAAFNSEDYRTASWSSRRSHARTRATPRSIFIWARPTSRSMTWRGQAGARALSFPGPQKRSRARGAGTGLRQGQPDGPGDRGAPESDRDEPPARGAHYYLAGIYMARGEQDLFQKEMTIFNDLQSRSRGPPWKCRRGIGRERGASRGPERPAAVLLLAALASLISACPGGARDPAPSPGTDKASLVRTGPFRGRHRRGGHPVPPRQRRHRQKFILETLGSGVCVFDYDGDGLQDIYFVQSGRLPGFTPKGPCARRCIATSGTDDSRTSQKRRVWADPIGTASVAWRGMWTAMAIAICT